MHPRTRAHRQQRLRRLRLPRTAGRPQLRRQPERHVLLDTLELLDPMEAPGTEPVADTVDERLGSGRSRGQSDRLGVAEPPVVDSAFVVDQVGGSADYSRRVADESAAATVPRSRRTGGEPASSFVAVPATGVTCDFAGSR